MFKKILVADRGEIACRVIATAKKMGIATVAVYSDADKNARHVCLADEAVHIGPAPSRESYLQAEKIIAAAKATEAEAIHPGYGFLSENEIFARDCEAAGIVFIGPKHDAIAAMGDKIASKKLAQVAGVNTIPGHNEAIADAEKAVGIAQKIGYPVMLKASAGGGGKGLRVALNDQEAKEGFSACRNEAQNSFGDDRIFVEKFIEQPRHIEIQILGDAHGHVVYLHERECSIQRRHQKVIEEAPSPFISEATRQAMGEQAVALAKAVHYQSAGTVEFVVGRDQSFYFLEMNTRLQVEHPVTECITGLDLVEWMIRIAAGEKLPLQQKNIARRGWAIECRINAEDPFRQFLPSTGRLVRFQPPTPSMQAADTQKLFGVRVDTGVQEGGEISMHYDSMIAKLIVHGADRAEAIAKMRQALNAFVIRGVASNIPFQAALLAHPDFVSGNFHTGFIATHYAQGFQSADVTHDDPPLLAALAAWFQAEHDNPGRSPTTASNLGEKKWIVFDQQEKRSWQVALESISPEPNDAFMRHVSIQVQTWANDPSQDVETHASIRNYALQLQRRDPLIEGLCNGQAFCTQVDHAVPKEPRLIRISHQGARLDAWVLPEHVAVLQQWMLPKVAPDMSCFVLSPMPGLLVNIAVQEGQTVQAGERVAVIEAMKMENVLFANTTGVVKKISATKGESLAVDQVIMEFESAAA